MTVKVNSIRLSDLVGPIMDQVTDYALFFGKHSILFGWSNYLVNQIFFNLNFGSISIANPNDDLIRISNPVCLSIFYHDSNYLIRKYKHP